MNSATDLHPASTGPAIPSAPVESSKTTNVAREVDDNEPTVALPSAPNQICHYCNFLCLDLKRLRRQGARVLDVGAGLASFTAEGFRLGLDVTAIDPLYRLRPSALELMAQSALTHDQDGANKGMRQLADSEYKCERGFLSLASFLDDFRAGFAQGRYRAGTLPRLPFANKSFALALDCFHLFQGAASRDFQLAYASCRELCRVAREVRIYPLTLPTGQRYPHLQRLRLALFEKGIEAALETVSHPVERNAEHCLILRHSRP
jgi:SAM-dependent methyltransferase